MPESVRRLLPWIAIVVVLIGFANSSWFAAESSSLGGDALNGYVRDGHYFVTSHGAAAEVTQADWEWSRLHGISVLATHLLVMGGLAFLLFTVFFPALMPSQAGLPSSDRLDAVRTSGPEVAHRRIAGQLGDLRLSGPLLDVAVHPGGIILKPPFMTPVVLLADEVLGLGRDRSWGSHRLTIQYRPGAWHGALRLFVGPTDPIAVAIGRFVTERDDREAVASVSSITPSAARTAKFPLVMRVWIVIALAISVVLVLSWDRPGLSPTFLFGAAIVAGNVYWLLIRNRHRW
jgi:hypothetical protein